MRRAILPGTTILSTLGILRLHAKLPRELLGRLMLAGTMSTIRLLPWKRPPLYSGVKDYRDYSDHAGSRLV